MPFPSAAPKKTPLDTLHAIKNEAARAAAKRMLLESSAADVAWRIAAHEAEVARRLDIDLHGAAPYDREERLADQQQHRALLEERDQVDQTLANMDARRKELAHQADEALARRCADDLAGLSARISERVHRFFSLWKQVALVVRDVEELCRQHRELQRVHKALRRKQGKPHALTPEARIPRAVEDMHQAVSGLASPPEPAAPAEHWKEHSAS